LVFFCLLLPCGSSCNLRKSYWRWIREFKCIKGSIRTNRKIVISFTFVPLEHLLTTLSFFLPSDLFNYLFFLKPCCLFSIAHLLLLYGLFLMTLPWYFWVLLCYFCTLPLFSPYHPFWLLSILVPFSTFVLLFALPPFLVLTIPFGS
jgi:hypothetical protein